MSSATPTDYKKVEAPESSFINFTERMNYDELTNNEFQEKMRDIGKVATFDNPRQVNRPIRLYGFSKDEVLNAWNFKLTVFHYLEAIEAAISQGQVRYELEKGETYRRYWLLDQNGNRVAYHKMALSEEGIKGGLRHWEIDVSNKLEEPEASVWQERAKGLKREVSQRLIVAAAKIVEEDQKRKTHTEVPRDNNRPKKRGPRETVLKRALIFKKIKDENPSFSYAQVAARVRRDYSGELGKVEIHKHDVRYAYKAMGWEWPTK